MLSDKDQELISIGASLAAGCQPCTHFHLRAARIAGASDAEISRAVNDAMRVRKEAAEGMAQLASQYLGAAIFYTNKQNLLLSELVSISAACAVNSVPDLETHLTAARRLGATDGQILSAIKIARAVKGMAERKVEEATGRAAGANPIASENCCNQSGEKTSGQCGRFR
jgi:AhpD family alkylhydroperoxidase